MNYFANKQYNTIQYNTFSKLNINFLGDLLYINRPTNLVLRTPSLHSNSFEFRIMITYNNIWLHKFIDHPVYLNCFYNIILYYIVKISVLMASHTDRLHRCNRLGTGNKPHPGGTSACSRCCRFLRNCRQPTA